MSPLVPGTTSRGTVSVKVPRSPAPDTYFLLACADDRATVAEETLYEPERHGQYSAVYGGHDPGVCCRYYLALCPWMLGLPDRLSPPRRTRCASRSGSTIR